MTKGNDNALTEVMEALTGQSDMGGSLADALRILLNHAMKAEREGYLKAGSYERSTERTGYANGYRGRQIRSPLGEIQVLVPQTRDGNFRPVSLEKGLRSERSLMMALAEAYVNGVSTRKVTRIVEELCGFEVSSSTVSRAAKELDEHIAEWRNRPLDQIEYLIADARYQKVRYGGRVQTLAVIWAIGIRIDGKREVLGVDTFLSEAEAHWREFLKSLVSRGLHGLKYIVSDDHEGLKKAIAAVFPGVLWNRCHTHMMRNAGHHVSRKEHLPDIVQDTRDILLAGTREMAQSLLERTINKWADKEPKFSLWAEEALPEGFAVFELPKKHRRKLRSTNLIERFNRELKRRCRTVGIFPSVSSCVRLSSALLMEIHEEWITANRYLPEVNN